MACTNPKRAYKYGLTKNGKQALKFKRPQYAPIDLEEQLVPCGKCVSCKLDYAKEWAIRIEHEAQTCGDSCFLTLTYNDQNLPQDKSVTKRELQLFIKKLRKKIFPRKIKYFGCGEYGEKRTRPHYHIIILGYDFPDKQFWKYTDANEQIYRSKILEQLWQKGYSSIGNVTFQTAAYVARYTLKKSKDKKQYEHVDTDTGELTPVKSEFLIMSRNIGTTWWNKYKTDTNKDYLLNHNGYKNKIPRWYDKLRDREDPESLEILKRQREEKAKEIQKDETKTRRKAKNKVKTVQNKMLIRGFEKC